VQLSVNDTTLYVEDTGPGSTGQTIVFSHGLLWDTSLFAPQIAALRSKYRCVAWDHRGQGKSAADFRKCIDMELLSQDAIALIEKLELGPVHFAGLSMGGFVAMRVAARRPDLVRSLILIETSGEAEPIENVGRYRTLTAVVRALGPWVVARSVAAIMLGRTILSDPNRKAEVATYTATMTQRKDIWRAVNGVIDRAPILGELSRINTPTLILVGDEDVATPRAKAERIRTAIAGSKLDVIPRAGHSSTVEEPARVTAGILGFLS
jgi:3-oxoadipate enol-lactonase